MIFEFDENKSLTNKEKHGIDFIEAQALWDDERLFEAFISTSKEPRCLAIGKIGEKHYSAVITIRGDSLRLISVRRSRIKEVEIYEKD